MSASAGTWGRRIALGLIGLAFLAGLVIPMAFPEADAVSGSVASAEASGRRAAFLLLHELGLEPEIWRQAPLALPEGEHVLWMKRAPAQLLAEDEDEAEDEGEGEAEDEAENEVAQLDPDDPILSDPRHPWNYAWFVRSGGTLVLPGTVENQRWLDEDCGLELPLWSPCTWEGPRLTVELEFGDELELVIDPLPDTSSLSTEELRLQEEGWDDLVVDSTGAAFVSSRAVDAGRVVLLGADGFLRNDEIGQGDNGLFFVRQIESLARGGRTLFDEYALGRWLPPSRVALLFQPGAIEILAAALLTLLLFVMHHAWRREFPRDPDPALLNPRMRSLAQARWLERAGRHDLSGLALRLGVLRRLVRRWKLGRREGELQEDSTAEAQATIARELALRIGHEDQAQGFARLFSERQTTNRAELEELAQDLAKLEAEVERIDSRPC